MSAFIENSHTCNTITNSEEWLELMRKEEPAIDCPLRLEDNFTRWLDDEELVKLGIKRS